MSTTLGIDISTRAIDLVRLDETSNQASWDHFHLEGKTALERLRQVPLVMPRMSWWEDVYLCGIEEPMSHGQPGTSAKLNRVLGAIAACVPAGVELWLVKPTDWRQELGLSTRASKEEAAEAVDALRGPEALVWTQDALDAYAVAFYARETNARALAR